MLISTLQILFIFWCFDINNKGTERDILMKEIRKGYYARKMFRNYDGISDNLYTFSDFKWINKNWDKALQFWNKVRPHFKNLFKTVYIIAKDTLNWNKINLQNWLIRVTHRSSWSAYNTWSFSLIFFIKQIYHIFSP